MKTIKEKAKGVLAWIENQGTPQDKGEISDGYHTFNELYYYRMLYNAAFFNMLPKEWVYKSKKHHDGEDCFGGGWFIVMANLPTGQISNHYELKNWDLFQIPEKEVADKWDCHTPQEAADRLHKYLLEKQGEKEYALKSSKDEDVHKFVQYIEKQAKAYELNLPNRSYDIYGFAKDILAWLEKQGTSYTKRDVDDAYVEGVVFAKNELEKQGEQKLPIEKLPEEMKTIEESLGFTTQKECDEYNQMVSGLIMSDEEDYNNIDPHFGKLINKVESKFKAGNWYQCIKDFFGKGVIFDKNTAYYCAKEGCLQNEYGCHIAIVKDLYDNFKLWTIQDAKAGDIIAADPIDTHPSPFVAIYKKQNEEYFDSYCFVGYDGNFYKADNGHSTEGIHPATKEQRDTLFAKMKEAGYEWDENNKILKEIVEDEEEPQNYKNQVMSEITDLVTHYIKQKSAWKPSDEQMEALYEETQKSDRIRDDRIVSLYNDLKKLKE